MTDQSQPNKESAPEELHPIRRNLWQRWMDWSGSFLVLSLILHIVLLGGATVVVVQVVQGRKERLKFTAPPPNPAGMVEHKVKPPKKSLAAAPAITKRITSSAANASIALPTMEMNSSSPDVMASVMNGLGSGGLGSGAGGAAGIASMPLAGLTAFGFRGTGSGGLVGHLYDLKQTKDHQPTEIKDDGTWKDPEFLKHVGEKFNNDQSQILSYIGSCYGGALKDPAKQQLFSDGMRAEAKFLNEFLSGDWSEAKLKQYYCAQDALTAYQWSIAKASAKEATKAFQVESEVKPTHLLIVYRGKVRAPRDGSFRFVTLARGGLVCVRFDEQKVFGYANYASHSMVDMKDFQFTDPDKKPVYYMYGAGKWFQVQNGKTYPVEIVLSLGAGDFGVNLMIEEKDPPSPYTKSKWQWQTDQGRQYQTEARLKNPIIFYRLPLFALRKGVPAAPFTMPDPNAIGPGKFFDLTKMSPGQLDDFNQNGPHLQDADPADEPTVFQGVR